MNRKQEAGTRNQGFRGLLAWQKADELASEVYSPLRDVAGVDRWLASQAIRSAISVPANIAEGYGRGSLGDYLRFIDSARGSFAELEYYLHFMTREGLIRQPDIVKLEEVKGEAARLLNGLWQSLRQKARNGTWDRTGGPPTTWRERPDQSLIPDSSIPGSSIPDSSEVSHG
jgi:four helix bundle protein